jgi:hypothetical protein
VRTLFANAAALLRSVEFYGCVQLWSRVGKVCNMHVERLLKRFKDDCKTLSSKAPDIERFSGAGFLGTWQRLHRAAGGNDVRVVKRTQLLEMSAPIAAARTPRKTSMVRASMLFANSRWAECEDRSPDGCKAFLQAQFAKYESLPEDERIAFEAQAAVLRAGELDEPEGRGEFNDSVLWGLPTRDAAVNVDVADKHIREKLGIEKDCNYGYKRWCNKLSPCIQDHLFCRDEG